MENVLQASLRDQTTLDTSGCNPLPAFTSQGMGGSGWGDPGFGFALWHDKRLEARRVRQQRSW